MQRNIQRMRMAVGLALAMLAVVLAGGAQATDGTWTNTDNTTNLLWSAVTNWNGTVATNGTADFSTLDITNTVTVSLDTTNTMLAMVFGDADPTNSPGTWAVNNNGDTNNYFTFASTSATLTNTVSNGVTATISAGIGSLGTAPIDGNANKILKLGAGKLVLSGQDYLWGTNGGGGGGVQILMVEDGGELSVSNGSVIGQSTLQSSGVSGSSVTVGQNSSNNTLRLEGAGLASSVFSGTLNIGASTFGGNQVIMSAPGSATNQTYKMWGDDSRMNIGVSSSGNSLIMSNGAYLNIGGVAHGNNYWYLGFNSGANSNQILVTGIGSFLSKSNGTGSAIYVGLAGSYNSLIISNGGTVVPRRIFIGDNGGNSNYLYVTGSGSLLSVSGSGIQAIFGVGSDSAQAGTITGAAGTNNYMLVDNGGQAIFDSGLTRGYNIGGCNGCVSNYVRVTGSGSVFTMLEGQPLAIGGLAGWNNNQNFFKDTTATDNHLDVFNGAQTFQNSVYLFGTNSAFNLGDGSGISQAEVRKSTGNIIYAGGIILSNASAQLNFNSGRLVAGVGLGAKLVSGAGVISNAGPAYIDTSNNTCSIECPMVGPGSLIKEGTGMLTLAGTTNTYSGATIVSNGTLQLYSAAGVTNILGTNTELHVFASGSVTGVVDLSFIGTNVIKKLYINEVDQGPGVFGTNGVTIIATTVGAGYLQVGAAGMAANFSAGPTNGFVFLTVNFTNSTTAGSGTITNCFWDFGDTTSTNTATVTNVAHTYTSAGTYTVQLIVADDAGAISTNTKPALIVVAPVPAPTFLGGSGYSLNTGAGPATATFNITTTNGIKYRILYNDDLLNTNGWAAVTPPLPDGWTNGVNGTILLQDTNTVGVTQRFYRLEAKSVNAP